ncbi:MAG: hypothetical protein ACK5N9_22825 [Pirellula sp.]|jgi:hypothetical protein
MLGTTLSVTTLFVVVASAAGLWSPLSQRWLRENGVAILNSGNSVADETLAMLVSLNALDQTNSTAPTTSARITTESPLPSSPILAAYHTTASTSDDNSIPPPPMHPSSASTLADNRPKSIKATLNDKLESRELPFQDSSRIEAKSAEFKRTQSKPPLIVPIGQPVSAAEDYSEQAANDDLRQLPLERLFPLLGSTQERRVRLVCDELSQRGIPNSLLDLAVQLARGDETIQLELLDRLTRPNEVSPAPLLCWMAQSSSKTVRKRAIAILGSLQDREVMQQLRFLATREPDSSLRQLIEQTVASSVGIK